MKLAILVLVFSFTFGFCVQAKSVADNISIDIPKEYTVITNDNIEKNTELLKKLNFDNLSFSSYISENKIILFAYDTNTKDEITVRKELWTDSINLDSLNDELFSKFAKTICGDAPYTRIESGGNVYICTQHYQKDAGGEFSSVRYVTVKEGTLYAIDAVFSHKMTDNDLKMCSNLISSVSFENVGNKQNNGDSDGVQGVNKIIFIIMLIVAIFAVGALSIYIIVTLVIDIRAKKNTSDVAPYVKIKRRKF